MIHFTFRHHHLISVFIPACTIFSGFAQSDDTVPSPPQLHLRDSLMKEYRPAGCNGATLNDCAASGKSGVIPGHMEIFLTWLVVTDPDPDPVKVVEQLDLRYAGFTDTQRVLIDTAKAPLTGNPKATVLVSVYMSSYCPHCKKMVNELHDSIAANPVLNSGIALVAKPIGGGIANIALLAAAEEGKFWDLFAVYKYNYSVLKKEADILPLAAKAGITSERFRQLLSDPAIRKRLAANTSESVKNGVKYMPGFFINNKRYSSYKKVRWILDAAMVEYERLTRTYLDATGR